MNRPNGEASSARRPRGRWIVQSSCAEVAPKKFAVLEFWETFGTIGIEAEDTQSLGHPK